MAPLSLPLRGRAEKPRVCMCVACACFWIRPGTAEVLKMKAGVELMVVKGPSVYLVLVNMKYNPSGSLYGGGGSVCFSPWVSVARSPLKAGFVCSHRSGSLGNLITRLKALSIRQITRSVCVCVCLFLCVCVRSPAWSVRSVC